MLARDDRIEADQAHGEIVDHVMQKTCMLAHVRMAARKTFAHDVAPIVIAGNQERRKRQLGERRRDDVVFVRQAAVRQIAGREQAVRTRIEAFDRVDTLGAPRLVEYWEADPCLPFEPPEPPMQFSDAAPEEESDDEGGGDEEKYKVKIEAKFSVGEYDIVVLSAKESTGLDGYLRANKYKIPAGAEPLLRPYVEQGTKFFVAKVDPKKVRDYLLASATR